MLSSSNFHIPLREVKIRCHFDSCFDGRVRISEFFDFYIEKSILYTRNSVDTFKKYKKCGDMPLTWSYEKDEEYI